MNNTLMTGLHIAIFAVTAFVFSLGLGIGLSANHVLGTALWVVAGLLAFGNGLWLVRRRRR